MDPALIAQLIVAYGIPFTERMIQLWENKQIVNLAEWERLKALLPTPEEVLAKLKILLNLADDDPRLAAVAELIAAR
jgi:hypothetical protein